MIYQGDITKFDIDLINQIDEQSSNSVAGSLLGWGGKRQYSPDGEDLQKERKKRTKKKAKSSFSRGNDTKVEFLVTTQHYF